MSTHGVTSSESILRLPRQIVAFFILLSSILLAIFLAIQTPAVVSPPSPTVRYNALLEEIYLNTDNWQTIHYIEQKINPGELSREVRGLFSAQVWNNFVKAPEEYADQLSQPGPILTVALGGRDGDFYTFIRDRRKYAAVSVEDYSTSQYASSIKQMVPILTQLRDQSSTAIGYINSGNTLAAKDAISALNTASSALNTTSRANNALTLGQADLQLLPQRYQLIVYAGFYLVTDSTLEDVAQQILFDSSEDPLLRVAAGHYLINRPDVDLEERLFIMDP